MVAVAQFFREEVGPPGIERKINIEFAKLLVELARNLPDSQELTAGVRFLLAARDCVIRAALLDLYVDDD